MRLLEEGQKIRGTYEVERYLGSGAFAEVYRVKHRFLGRQAIKVFKQVGMTTAETEGMLSEAVMLSRLGHPNIIRVFDANTTETSGGSCGFFTMEYMAGGTLEQFWRSHGPRFVPIETTVDILCQVSRGLSVAHAETPPIIHRDIKPQNILVGYDAVGLCAKISDFGLAKQVNPLTLLATTQGTRSFKPPEVFLADGQDSCTADVWALGTVLYLLLTDRLPFSDLGDGDTVDETRFSRPLIPPSRINMQADSTMDQIVYRALALKPEDRFPSAAVFLKDLARWRLKPEKARLKINPEESLEDSKTALGRYALPDEEKGHKMAKKALRLARETGKLMEASDLMEEAFNVAPKVRTEYEDQLKLWHRGIVM